MNALVLSPDQSFADLARALAGLVRSPLAEELRGPVARLMADAERVVHGVRR